ncbi:MAG: glycine--tRNA ligase subunit beta [Gammaproteobacteria bacterium]|nr:glycine--tRNA ligase subunit beta [Gammaproteobacteria bacterium]
MYKKDLLLEIGTEELPPKSLTRLASSLAGAIRQGLQDKELEHGDCSWYATPRRLAVIVRALADIQPDKETVKRGPSVASAYDEAGNPTRAAEGFARSCGVKVAELDTLKTDKGSWLSYSYLATGARTEELLPVIIERALAGLPISRRMRWGDGDIEFVRPVHWAVLLFGEDIVRATVLGTETGRNTRGHRFHHPETISLASAGEYLARLQNEGHVTADFSERKKQIRQAATDAAQALGRTVLMDEDLLDEVTALVEWPVTITGSFDEQFLELPAEALIATMQSHQKYFPVTHPDTGELTADFIAVANIDSVSPELVKQGNERVITPRLSDAAFFWERDRSLPLESLTVKLDKVIFEQKLGTLADKTARIGNLGEYIAGQLELDSGLVERAARLAKCDLLSDMVGEFPELQGIMGRYYALENNEHPEVARALEEQYMPIYAGADLPETDTGKVLALADKLDTLAGIFAIGKGPTGDKDPYGLRRAGLGCLRIMIECELPLDLEACLAYSAGTFPESLNAPAITTEVFDFMLDRLRRYYLDAGISPAVFDAVQACRPAQPHDFNLRVLAVGEFLRLPEADSLVTANKRISNILKQAQYTTASAIDEALLVDKTERELHNQMLASGAEQHGASRDYIARLAALAGLRDYVDAFFDEVMVLCEDDALRKNRLALLNELRRLFLATADISRLQ